MPKPRSLWADVPDAAKEKMQENTRQAKLRKRQENAYRKELREAQGTGRRGVQIRSSIQCRNRLRAITYLQDSMNAMLGRDVKYIGWRRSAAEALRRLVDREYDRMVDTVSYAAGTDGRAVQVLEKGQAIAQGWQ